MGHFAAMRKWLLFLLGVLVVEFIVAPLGGRVFDRVFPEERGFTGMIPDIPFYQWGYASILALGLVLGIASARWQARRAAKVISSQDDVASPKALPIVAVQEEAVLSLANDDDHVHKRIPDIYGSHAIRAKIEAKYVDEGLPILHDISRWHDGAWHSLK